MNAITENRLKSVFLSALIAYGVVVMVVGLFAMTYSPQQSIWLGVAVAAGQIAVYFARLYLVRVPRTSPNLVGFTLGIFAATMYSVYMSYAAKVASPAPLLALLSLVGWVAYVGWYSELGDRSKDKIKVGKKLPNIPLEDYDGNKLSSDDWKGSKRLVIFYRGNWCPICTAQVNELGKFEKKFEELGVKVTLISPQSHDKSRKHAQRTGMNYDFLVDVNNQAAIVLGILHEKALPAGLQVFGYQPDIPKPTTFVMNEDGKVIYADLTTNYRLRPKPEDILAAIRK